jgi:hypothetical protein
VGGEVVERRISRGEDLQPETPVKRPRAHFGSRKALGDPVVGLVRGGRAEGLVNTEELPQFVLEPQADDRPTEAGPMVAQLTPHLARYSNLVLRLGQRVHAQVGERDTVPVKEAKHVVVGAHQERNGIDIRFVAGEHRRVDVAVRRDEGEARNLLVQRSGYLA